MREPVAIPGFCRKSILEILQVIELRPTETMERIEEMVGAGLERERVSRAWGNIDDFIQEDVIS